ncbi:hypothetical protein INT48_003579 [Thamnidium elegans]|uniref:C2H2-type domain-containing protein n=1 Tax=Thamnidium elegans TaxID=101142 RepID=A0A8H7SLK2_9FUNG|nr:hypothetical protein INT48_003579 [Thamnidium elegans]
MPPYSEPSNFDSKSCPCKACDVRYTTNLNFTTHFQEIHRIAPPSRSDLIPNIGNQNNYCVACDKTFSSGQSYLTHQSSFPIYETPEIYLGRDSKNPSKKDLDYKSYCAGCQKIFLSKWLHQTQMANIHNTEPPKY